MNLTQPIQASASSSVDILGTPVALLSVEEGIRLLTEVLAARRYTPVSFLNAHNANVSAVNQEFAEAMRRFLILADGVGVDIASKALYGHPFPDNLNGTDFIPAFLVAHARPLCVGLLGATQENADAAAAKLATIAPQHHYAVISNGFFSRDREPAILAELVEVRPDILLVAMGVPRQELWIAQNLDARHCTVPIGVGALLDFLSGNIPRAPKWVRDLRLEWLFRLINEPSRLWRRYILGNPVFLWRVLMQKLRQGRQEP
ncbi:MAG: WecB/TagA/CpsF family glycosyltransferase [Notoacmeibacter sp.]|nr:WecB/TagA/CpsF family glycosyltransferase [Notoacmeibacter sp.]